LIARRSQAAPGRALMALHEECREALLKDALGDL